MKAELSQLIKEMRRLGCGLPDRLAKGKTIQALKWFPHPLPKPVQEWWAFADGPVWGKGDVAEDVWLKPGYYPLSLEDAESDYTDNAGRFKDTWLPIMTDGGGDFLVVDCADEACPVLLCAGDDEIDRVYDSLDSMVETFIECIAQGVFFIDDDGNFDTDDDNEARISLKLNPKSKYWVDFP
jgi:hypothetical protein